MDSTIIIDFENHRSRERIKDMGEVFTPEQYVQQMLSSLDSSVWADESVVFFEPSCGHGNIVLPIFLKRVKELKRSYSKQSSPKIILQAVANCLNTLWAIDICAKNVELTRKRIFEGVLNAIKADCSLYEPKTREFVAHAICTISWQIHENEALSSLGTASEASLTKLGRDWLRKNDHRPIQFENTWCNHFLEMQKKKTEPIQFQRAIKFVESSIESKNIRGFEEFNFAKELIQGFTVLKRNTKGIEIEVA